MITINKKIDGPAFSLDGYEKEELLFFDIETTGFVADKSYLYLIGCSYYQNDSWQLIQWFSEGPTEEIDLLHSFIEFVGNYRVCIHFNGTTFDIPYVTRKCKKLNLDFSFQDLVSIDLYKTACSLKKLLHLERCTQKAMENVMGLHREDLYSGGELIQVYANYLGLAQLEKLKKLHNSPDLVTLKGSDESADQLLQCLLLHNAEDVSGLLFLSCLFAYDELFQGKYTLANMSFDSEEHLCFELALASSLPKAFASNYLGIELQAQDSTCLLKVPLKEGTLKYYIEDYKDYYYLPLEDTVVHKSIAASMDKDYRKRATKENCYLKKLSIFLPQFTAMKTPAFMENRKDILSYFECTEECLADSDFLLQYTRHLLSNCVMQKKRPSSEN